MDRPRRHARAPTRSREDSLFEDTLQDPLSSATSATAKSGSGLSTPTPAPKPPRKLAGQGRKRAGGLSKVSNPFHDQMAQTSNNLEQLQHPALKVLISEDVQQVNHGAVITAREIPSRSGRINHESVEPGKKQSNLRLRLTNSPRPDPAAESELSNHSNSTEHQENSGKKHGRSPSLGLLEKRQAITKLKYRYGSSASLPTGQSSSYAGTRSGETLQSLERTFETSKELERALFAFHSKRDVADCSKDVVDSTEEVLDYTEEALDATEDAVQSTEDATDLAGDALPSPETGNPSTEAALPPPTTPIPDLLPIPPEAHLFTTADIAPTHQQHEGTSTHTQQTRQNLLTALQNDHTLIGWQRLKIARDARIRAHIRRHPAWDRRRAYTDPARPPHKEGLVQHMSSIVTGNDRPRELVTERAVLRQAKERFRRNWGALVESLSKTLVVRTGWWEREAEGVLEGVLGFGRGVAGDVVGDREVVDRLELVREDMDEEELRKGEESESSGSDSE